MEKYTPSPSSSSPPPPSPPNAEVFSVMNLLPAASLVLVSILSLQDREVLAYMITRSMKSTNPATVSDEKKKTQKKSGMPHKPSVFDCECFDCYTSYWFRWDSSPNHELIHQAIEAFEDHLSNPSKKVRGKKRDKSGRFDSVRFADTTSPDGKPGAAAVSQPENNVIEVASVEEDARETSEDAAEEVAPVKEEAAVAARGGVAVSGHKGLARKVLSDVLELFNPRLWGSRAALAPSQSDQPLRHRVQPQQHLHECLVHLDPLAAIIAKCIPDFLSLDQVMVVVFVLGFCGDQERGCQGGGDDNG
ncbi:LOW QUALITY PROTEIN: hypothetical protein RJ640_011509 [Escallonia rubra]|uniref:Uncharacterized protein n=1 Tax=Escallonia rubra TaxID=112253 RepID=A0AA88ULK3_9ASTE|nr:LOW QUALITY PROTEIN: hypothetical protein RJ640_011509 [Escallonia rubra]